MIEIFRKREDWSRSSRTETAPVLEGINESVTLRDADTNEIVCIQYLLPTEGESDKVRRQLSRQLKLTNVFHGSKGITGVARLSGIQYESETFGYVPPVKIRRRFGVSSAALNRERPEIANLLDYEAKELWEAFQMIAPEMAADHLKIVEESILKDWWLAQTPFSSGIINNTAALPYHKDSSNVQGALSMMLCLRRHVRGGCLNLPEYGVTFGIPNNSAFFFNGQKFWHGVTPLDFTREDAYRYTIVYYTKREIMGAEFAKDEIAAAKRLATNDEAGESRKKK